MKPELIKDWDYSLNGEIDPTTIKDHSNKKYYWKCPKGHPSYLQVVDKRAIGHGCPICSNHRIVEGINDFASVHPELMEEWLWAENVKEGIVPTKLGPVSSTSAWWKCNKCGNAWKASISNRVRMHSGCPYCANLKVKKGYNDLKTNRPDLAAEWDNERNGTLHPDDVVTLSSKRVWWKCSKCGNSWQSSPGQRAKSGCPFCANLKVKKGFNDLETTCPDLVNEWDYEKNGDLLPSQVVKGSERKAWWKCEKGHSWQAAINSRAGSGRGCPYCSNQKILVGYNDIFSTSPELREEWDYEKNTIDPSTVAAGSNKRAYWVCKECGHKWNAIISSRTQAKYGCPKCSREKSQVLRLKTMASNNPLFERYPELLKEWDFEKNANIDISLLAASSNRYAWWKCEKGHSFKSRINSRTMNNVGCPYCHGQKVLTGVNDLQTLIPELAEEWDYEKNYPLKPSEVFSHGVKHVWWKCPACGNSWKAKIDNRANGRGCPNCNLKGTSFIEQTLFFYLKTVFTDALNRYLYFGTELDIYIPSIRTAIEYDGSYYHSSEGAKEREARKDLFCKENEIRLVRLRETPLEPTKDAINISCDCSNWERLGKTCVSLIRYLEPTVNADINIKRDYPTIIGSKKELAKENSIAKLYPDIVEEWDYEKNVPLDPYYFTRGSNVKVWWKCKKGHSWQASISNRCRQGTRCPVCFNKRRDRGLHWKGPVLTTEPVFTDGVEQLSFDMLASLEK